jgi:hypothetical protein
MAQQTIDVGSAANTGGESFYSGATKINANLTELESKILAPAEDDLIIYVSPSGSDSNSGLTPFDPVLTLVRATRIVHDTYFTTNGQVITIKLADGTYTASTECLPVHGNGVVRILGNSVNPANVLLTTGSSSTLLFATPCRYLLAGCEVRCSTGSGTACVVARQMAYVQIGTGMIFGPTSASSDHINATDQGIVSAVGNYSINGGCRYHYHANYDGLIKANGITCTVTSSVSMTRFARAIVAGTIESFSSTYVNRNNVSTSAFNADIYENSVINCQGGTTANYFPGNGGPDANGTSNGYCY